MRDSLRPFTIPSVFADDRLGLDGVSPPASPIPVVVLAGFLGAGKTTLLNHILRGSHGRRIAVLVNDFGEVNIDAGLVESIEGEDLVSLENGCVCCTIRGDLLGAVVRLLRRPSPPEAILVEASGVSYPSEVAKTFFLAPLREFLSVGGIVGVIDCEQALEYPLEASDLAAEQVSMSDLVLLNKADLVDEAKREAVREWVRGIVPLARVIETTYARVPIEVLVGLDGGERLDGLAGAGVHVHSFDDVGHAHAGHVHEFYTWAVRDDSPLAFSALAGVMDTLPPDILRGKGWVYLADTPDERVLFQQVGTRASMQFAGAWGDRPPRTELVFISLSREVDAADLRLRFESCRAATASVPLRTRAEIEKWMQFQG